MARTASVAIAGYYPTPEKVVPLIASHLKASACSPERRHYRDFSVLDPCAGDGDAVLTLVQQVFSHDDVVKGHVDIYACEMERSRFTALKKRAESQVHSLLNVLHGDAFRLAWSLKDNYSSRRTGASLLFLNPPYDIDPVHGRLEERFLVRFTEALCDEGVLVFQVPFYALKACAETIARNYHKVQAFRFPDGEFEAFKQVVVFGTKRKLLSPDAKVLAKVQEWAKDARVLPELGSGKTVASVPSSEEGSGFLSWEIAEVDIASILAKTKAWHTTDRGGKLSPIAGILPQGQAIDALSRTYPVAMPPRPAHIAAGIAAGVFNGAMIKPDNELSGLPPILVKGVFDREFETVEARTNKDGETTGYIQIQQPKLVVTALDLREKTFHTIRSSAEVTGAKSVDSMTTGDLLTSYGRGLMSVMLDHCPVMYDPARLADQIDLPPLPRKLFKAQGHAVQATVKLLGGLKASKAQRRGKAAFVLGEIGSGKSTVALAAAETIAAKRVLVMCPPHLLDGWKEQVTAVVPWAKVVTLANVADVDALKQDNHPGMIVAIMSREAAKLGHAWVGVYPLCPKCGEQVPSGDLAKARAHCQARRLTPRNTFAKLAVQMALKLLPVAAESPVVQQVLRSRNFDNAFKILTKEGRVPPPWEPVRESLKAIVGHLAAVEDLSQEGFDALRALLHAIGDDALTSEVLFNLYNATAEDTSSWGPGADARRRVRSALFLFTPNSPEQTGLVARLRDLGGSDKNSYSSTTAWEDWEQSRDALASGKEIYSYRDIKISEGAVTFRDHAKGTKETAIFALSLLVKLGLFAESVECGEILYQAIPQPARVPLATYISKKAPNLIDLLVLDEGHEYAGDGSAQGFAAHRLTGLGIPTLMMTGSVMNGYAESLFANQWALDPEFRAEFSRDQRQEFVRRYGYLKQLVEEKDKDTGKVIAFGAVTDRVETSVRTIGSAPGVLPLFVLRYLLRLAVTLHKADLALDLPPRFDLVERIEPSAEQKEKFESLQKRLMDQIRKDQFSDRAGKLWGQMAELPSFLDRATADVGNGDSNEYVIAYPESEGGGTVASTPLLPASILLPKEEWMIAKVKSELAEGRKVLIFTWHVALMPRLARLIEQHTGEKCPILDANKVAAGKRQAWINKEVIGKDRKVLVVNPVAVQTGLNNLVWFSTQIWMENPACNAIVFRQATGRIDRIGQTQEVRIIFPVYAVKSQETLHKLLLHKVAVSMSTDGLDAESALQAAGVGESQAMSTMAIGRQLYEMLQAAA